MYTKFGDLKRVMFNFVLRTQVDSMTMNTDSMEISIEFHGYKIHTGFLDFEERYYVLIQCEDETDSLYNYLHEDININGITRAVDSILKKIAVKNHTPMELKTAN